MKTVKKAYFIGIKGVGMTALAILLKEKGVRIEGSDVGEIFQTDEILKSYGIPVKKGFDEQNVPKDADLVITTGAHGSLKNSEAKKALQYKIKTISHGQALGLVMEGLVGISVAGSHGKTTTSAMTASIFVKAKTDPSYIIGTASIPTLKASGHAGIGKYFIAEADEYITAPGIDNTPRFLWQHPMAAVITNIEYDHPDAFSSLASVIDAFVQFASNIKKGGTLVMNKDHRNTQEFLKKLTPRIKVITYGFSQDADFHITNYKVQNGKTSFHINHKKQKVEELTLLIPGQHNALNATAAYVIAHFFAIPQNTIKNALSTFQGTKRRFEKVGNVGDILLYDDYAHHPSEVRETLKAFKQMYPKRRIITIFQPHTYSRTKALQREFVDTFLTTPDPIIVTDIFASAREGKDKEISSNLLVRKTRILGKQNIFYLPKPADIRTYIKQNHKKDDCIVTMGAGDVYKLQKDIKKSLHA